MSQSKTLRRLRSPGSRALLAASIVSVTGALPIFMLAALVALVRPDIGLDEGEFGAVVSVFFGTAAVASMRVGALTERLGGAATLAVGASLSAIAMLGIASADALEQLLVWSLVAGVGHVASQLGANHRLSFAIPTHRQGLAFGIRQSGPPAASLLGGLSVPWVAVAFGWRVAVAGAAVVPLLVGATQVRPAFSERRMLRATTGVRGPRVERRASLMIFALAAAFVTAPLTALASFLVDYLVVTGMRPGPAGLLLAAVSVVAILVRVSAGWGADRRSSDPVRAVSIMVAAGAVGFAALGRTGTALGLTAAATIAYGVGWGWPGIFIFGIVRRHPYAPAAATGIPQMGMFGGGALGPALFGAMVIRYGYDLAWDITAGSMAVGASLLAVAAAAESRPSAGLNAERVGG